GTAQWASGAPAPRAVVLSVAERVSLPGTIAAMRRSRLREGQIGPIRDPRGCSGPSVVRGPFRKEIPMAERRPVVRSLPSAASRLRADVLRRPSATALLVLVFAGGLGLGSFAHLVMAGDHRATEIADRAAASGALTRN